MNKPTVSVVMITYGHEHYIKQAIEGVLMQKCNFKIDLLIANDCSPDDTDFVVRDIIKHNPKSNWIQYTRHDQNMGMMPNFIWALKQAKGKYIALCEGDDYWTDPLKLQKQVGFLEENEEFKFSMGKVKFLNFNNGLFYSPTEHVNPLLNEVYSLKDYLKARFSQTSSFVFRNDNNSFPTWFETTHAGDQSIVVIKTGIDGKIKYHNDFFSVYRVNEGGVTTGWNLYKISIDEKCLLHFFDEITNYKFKNIIRFRILKINSLYSQKLPSILERLKIKFIFIAYNFFIKF